MIAEIVAVCSGGLAAFFLYLFYKALYRQVIEP